MNKVRKEYIDEFAKTMKVGLVATKDFDNNPHVTILSTLMAKDETHMMFAEFINGLSKENIQKNNKAGFLIMNLERNFWTGKMIWTHSKKEGEDYEMYNMQPKYRYNSYFGVHTVHYANLVDIDDMKPLDMKAIVANSLKVALAKAFKKPNKKEEVLRPWATSLLKKLDTLVFISYIDEDDFPVIIPIIPAQANSTSRIVIAANPEGDKLRKIKENQRVALFGLNLDMENVLLKGVFSGFKGGFATVDIDRVYNSMPPVHGYIYP